MTHPGNAADGDRDTENTLRGNAFHVSGRVRGPVAGRLADLVAENEALASEPFTGITSDGNPEPGLFPLHGAGPSTASLAAAASDLLTGLDPQQQAGSTFALDDENWRRWSNIAPNVMRHGLLLEDLTNRQRDAALDLLRATLSPEGFATARGVMRLNHTIAEITGDDEQYGEWLYWLSLFGHPDQSGGLDQTEPWGWQIDGHHLVAHCLVIGNQLVTTPLFWGSEPVIATTGKYAGITLFRAEEALGLAVLNSLTPRQRLVAVLGDQLPAEVFTRAYRDNFEMRFEGIPFPDLTDAQQTLLLQLIGVYVGRTRADHAKMKMAEVRRHLERTYFAWIRGTGPDAVFYYRVHSPVILIEFDHLPGIAFTNNHPTRRHIHTVVRTPNGNDYGRDLLRQHREQAHHPTPTKPPLHGGGQEGRP